MAPVPKRDDKRRNRVTAKADKIYAEGEVEQPDPPAAWGQQARAWYESLAQSAQAEFYEASDWQTAIVAGWLLDEWMNTRRATTMGEFRMLCAQLVATEGERRRARLEIHRNAPEEEKKGAVAVSEYKARLGVVS
jgi:hypothetical protein